VIDGFPAFAPELAAGGASFDAAHFPDLDRLESGNFWFMHRNILIINILLAKFPGARRFLEVGCGTGFVLSALASARPQMELTASEVHSSGLAYAARRVPQAQLMQMDARHIPYADEFDVIGAFDVLEHIEDDRSVLRALWRAVVPGGGVLLTVPQHPALWSEYDRRAGHVRRYRAQELRQKVEEAGFVVLKMLSFVSLLLPLLLMSRLRQRSARADYDPLGELRIAPWLNTLLATVCRMEEGLIRHGVEFPAGGSLLLAARKP